MRRRLSIRLFASAWLALLFNAPCVAQTAQSAQTRIGIVVMHGKGGSPAKYVAELASGLEMQGYLVANLEMPWSGARSYDAPVATAESEVDAALAALRSKGATHLFVAGHSQGGLFALYFGGRHPLDGIIAIAPGGNVASPAYRERLGDSLSHARQLIAAGNADEKTRLQDFERSRGMYTIWCTPANYLSWFDPDGAMNELKAMKSMDPECRCSSSARPETTRRSRPPGR